MKLELGCLTAENFQSFKNLDFDFRNVRGMSTLIMGDNRDDELASSNGAGKSVILEAISWVLFGTTFRTLRYADEVINLQEDSCQVRLDLILDNKMFTVFRTRKKGKSTVLALFEGDNELMVDSDSRSKQAQLESILGFNFETFTNSVMFHLDYVAFPELKPAERAEILTEIGNLDIYVKAATQAKQETVKMTSDITTLYTQGKALDQLIEDLKQEDFDTKLTGWENNRTERIKELRTSILELKEEKADEKDRYLGSIEVVNSAIAEIEEGLITKNEKLKVLTEGLDEELEKTRNRKEQLTIETTSMSNEINSLKNEKDKHTREIQKMTSMKGGKCPTCHQDITAEHVAACSQELLKKITDTETQITEKNALYDRLRASQTAINDELKKYRLRKETADELNKEVVNLDKRLVKVKGSLEIYKSQLGNLEKNLALMLEEKKKQLSAVRQEINPYIELKANQQERIEAKQLEVLALKEKIDALLEDQSYISFYIEGFKRIKMMLFDDLVGRLNELTQEYLSRYTSELSVGISCERQTKTGTKDEIYIEVNRPEGSISYAAYSGGERQKIKLSISLALAQVIEEMCNRECDVVFFDEPNNGLDNVGKKANFDILSDIANQGKTVVVIDHDAYFQDSFDNIIAVVKEKGYSRLEIT